MKHTKGKWELSFDFNEIIACNGIMEETVCKFESIEKATANANLIVAAPELLGALQKVEDWIMNKDIGDGKMVLPRTEILQAIKKATS